MKAKTSKEQFEKARDSASKAFKYAKLTATSLVKLLREGSKTAIYGFDGTDRWIGSKIQTKNILLSRMKNHLLKLALAAGLLGYYWPSPCNKVNSLFETKKWENHLVYGIDVSHFNDFNIQELSQENKRFTEDADSLTNPKKFIILRATQGVGQYQSDNKERGIKKGDNLNDIKFAEYFAQLNAYNEACDDENEKIRFATYHLYVPSHDPLQQAENYWDTLVSTLWEEKVKNQTPILDIEMKDITNAPDKDKLLNDFLQCCRLVEEKFGEKPIIYTSNSALKDFFRKDSRFASYPFWIAAYGNNDLSPEKIQKQWGGKVLSQDAVVMHQFTEQGKVAGMWAQASNQTDINVMARSDFDEYFKK